MSVLDWALGAVLLAGAAAKLAAARRSAAAMGTFGLAAPGARRAVLAAVVGAEGALGVGVVLGSRMAAIAAACLLLVFAVALSGALAAGRAGRPCGCLGPRSRVSRAAVARNLILSAAFALLPVVDGVHLTRQRWTEILAAGALAGVVVLGVLVAGLAREVGALRMRLAPQLALDIAGEGPAPGTRHAVLAPDGDGSDADLGLAIFTSPGCPMCAALEPAIGEVRRDPRLAVAVFDEERHRAVWEELAIPGSPYAVVSSPNGTVLAKGTFNSLGQLDSLLAEAGGRRTLARA